ncbi:acidic mammalian chitinase-like [Cydia splendana]|uniref:acidic mammalian chitinase-like n=1 Tax=Cydia splendana TaxID=1100963 RepID=UPI00300C5D47
MKVLVVCALLCLGGSLAAASGVVVCYYGEWANERPGVGRFGVSDLPTDLCTHIVYSFLLPNGTTGGIIAPEETTYEGKGNSVADLIALKEKNADLKIMAAIGGWNEGSTNFTALVNDDTLRATLVSNLYNYIDSNGFDGLDLDWEYPAQRGGADTDKEQFVTLVKELKEAFAAKSYLLTAAVAVTQSNIDLSYDVTGLNEYLDYFHLMLYDFYGSWNTETGVNAPLYAQLTDDASLKCCIFRKTTKIVTILRENEVALRYSNHPSSSTKPSKRFRLRCVYSHHTGLLCHLGILLGNSIAQNNSVNVWISNGATPSKLVLGLGAYGKTFTLTSLNNTSTGAPVTGAGAAGPYVAEAGTYSYYEICEDQVNNAAEWNITEVEGNYVYANKDLFWVGYDNPNTIKAKAQYAKTMGLGGIMYWAVDLDDFGGLCGDKYPLISAGIAGYNSA